ncbi:transcriptional regulator [Kitasatospora cinereorecta]|uniref:Transcriptional regulator n=1 Tax=Kitasatospora cinereorecta TaxID=285560 RepID=A0ABW0VMD1_9ACTN
MLAKPRGTLAYPDTSRERRLAAQLRGMIVGADAILVSLVAAHRPWPHAHASAMNVAGKPVRMNPTTAQVAARWVLRTWPDADWSRPQVLDLFTGELTAGTCTIVRGR